MVHKLINVRSIYILGYFRMGAFDSIDLPLILFKPDECFTNFLYKCWSNCNNILLLQFLYFYVCAPYAPYMCKKLLVSKEQVVVLTFWSTSWSMLGQSTSWVTLEWEHLTASICPSYSLNLTNVSQIFYTNVGQTVTTYFYYNFFI